jgi:prophage regulatory protein
MNANTYRIPRQAGHVLQVAEPTHVLCKLDDSSPTPLHSFSDPPYIDVGAKKCSAPRLIRLPEVIARTGLSRSSIYRLEKQGRFVSRVRLGERAIAWRLEEVAAWIEGRPLADTVQVPVVADANIAINAMRARGLVNARGNAKQMTFKGRVLDHVMEHGRLAHSQLNALMQPAADKDVRIACRKLAADGDINITEVGGLTVYVDVRVES